jgi:hypothetical protein
MRSTIAMAVVTALLAVTAPVVGAQAPVDAIGPRAGSWGAEVTAVGSPTASLLYFSSPRAAWLLGLTFDLAREKTDNGVIAESHNVGSVNARIGRRWWRGDAAARLRPLTGVGISGGISNASRGGFWSAGGYGELGATYFFSPHISLGASGELAAAYSEDRFANPPPGSDFVSSRWSLHGTLVRASAGVYF